MRFAGRPPEHQDPRPTSHAGARHRGPTSRKLTHSCFRATESLVSGRNKHTTTCRDASVEEPGHKAQAHELGMSEGGPRAPRPGGTCRAQGRHTCTCSPGGEGEGDPRRTRGVGCSQERRAPGSEGAALRAREGSVVLRQGRGCSHTQERVPAKRTMSTPAPFRMTSYRRKNKTFYPAGVARWPSVKPCTRRSPV